MCVFFFASVAIANDNQVQQQQQQQQQINDPLIACLEKLTNAIEKIDAHMGQMNQYHIDNQIKLKLRGLHQHYIKLRKNDKRRKLIDLLGKLKFDQLVIFVKSTSRCTALCKLLTEQGFSAIEIHYEIPQEQRLARCKEFKECQKRILVATNLFERDMGIDRVNIVFNYDMPEDIDTYLRQVTRAGRFPM
ncbi:unnamed protein product [Rotaria sp. Silwood1]|nr:unnamed protein product [Rotaria sp. Silwood1]